MAKKGAKQISAMNKGGTQTVAGIKITMVHAVHSCGIEDEDGSMVYGGEACGYVLELPGGVKLYHAGDTAVFGAKETLIKSMPRSSAAKAGFICSTLRTA
jgi:L-ascorbate metabolism protein UlaG (beta-lactamase superfamily)